jgi:hypothetical protein
MSRRAFRCHSPRNRGYDPKERCLDKITSLDKFRVPIGNQEIELQQIEYAVGGMPMLRIRIREQRRFTIFDIDPITAERWGKQMQEWGRRAQEEQ